MTRILVIDDDAALRRCVCSVLENAGYEVVEAADGADGLQQYLAAPTAVVITDLEMPVMDGLQMITVLRHAAPTAAVIAVSGTPHALTKARTLTPAYVGEAVQAAAPARRRADAAGCPGALERRQGREHGGGILQHPFPPVLRCLCLT